MHTTGWPVGGKLDFALSSSLWQNQALWSGESGPGLSPTFSSVLWMQAHQVDARLSERTTSGQNGCTYRGLSTHRHIFTCMHMHACTCMLIPIGRGHIHKSAFLWMCTHVYKYRQGHTHVHTCVYIYLQVHVALSLAHIHIFTWVFTCIYALAHTWTQHFLFSQTQNTHISRLTLYTSFIDF